MTWPRVVAIVLAAPTGTLVAAAVTAQLVAGSAAGAAEVALTSTVALAITGLALRVTSRPGLGSTVEAELPPEETPCAS